MPARETGGVAILALNIAQRGAHPLSLPRAANRYTLTSRDLSNTTVLLNGILLRANPDGSHPPWQAEHLKPGPLTLAPLSVTFLSLPAAQNAACR
jgi:hypothetical protein